MTDPRELGGDISGPTAAELRDARDRAETVIERGERLI